MARYQFTRINSNNNPTLTKNQILAGSFYTLLDSLSDGSGKIDINALLDKTFTSDQISGTGSSITCNISGSKANDLCINPTTKNLYLCTAANTWKYLMKLDDTIVLPSGFCCKSWRYSWADDYDGTNSPLTGTREFLQNNGATITELDSMNTDGSFYLSSSPSLTPRQLELIFPNDYSHVMWNTQLSFSWHHSTGTGVALDSCIAFGDSNSITYDTNFYSLVWSGQFNSFGEYGGQSQAQYAVVIPKYFRMWIDGGTGSSSWTGAELAGKSIEFNLIVNWKVLE